MNTTTLQAEVREGRGKGPARRLRKMGMIPAVFYGPGMEPTPLTVNPEELEKALHGVFGRNTLFTLAYDGKEELAMVRDLEVTPVGRKLVHADFLRVSTDREVVVEIPVSTKGRAVGVVKGGVLNLARRTVPVRCTPDKIPAGIEIDVSDVDLYGTISVADLPVGEGQTVMLRPELTIVIVLEDKKAKRLAAKEAKEAAAAEGGVAPAPE